LKHGRRFLQQQKHIKIAATHPIRDKTAPPIKIFATKLKPVFITPPT
jgi:hypothetical protein